MKKKLKGQVHNIVFACCFVLLTVIGLLFVFVVPRTYKAADYQPDRTFSFATAAPQDTTDGIAATATVTATAAPATPEPSDMGDPDPDRTDASAEATEIPTGTPTEIPTQTPSPTPEPTPEPDYTKGGFTDGKVLSGDDFYIDGNINIHIKTYRELNTDIHMAEVYLRTAEYFRTAFAKNKFGRNITEDTSVIARENGAIFAINGDYYGARNKGYVIRNGVVYRTTSSSRDVLAVMEDGTLKIVKEGTITATDLFNQGAWQAFSFGPGLIVDGQISVDKSTEVKHHLESNPRTAIGMISPLHYIFVVSDGRTEDNEGLTLYELAEFMQSLGAQQGYNMDGGGSSTMVFMGNVINKPTSYGTTISERSVSDIVYIR